MKYVLTWTNRLGGSAQDNEASVRRGLELFSKWQPLSTVTFHQFVGRLDGDGGFAVLETENPADLLDGTGKFGTNNEFCVYPVIEIADWIQKLGESVDFRESIS